MCMRIVNNINNNNNKYSCYVGACRRVELNQAL